ncbi:uracil-DNA glycosylase family protein [Joostella sp.]|uniref:uracil-DNA glycosylase family protein n=1 Tax=Joostella sp. TaxID=2231138 RepID=UPI003A92FA4A
MIITKKNLTEELIKIIQTDIINIPKENILDLYESWSQTNEKSSKWVFDKKYISEKQFLPLNAYLLGIDFPYWFGNISAKKRIMVIGIDPLRNENVFNKVKADKNNDVLIGTPYALHSIKMREGRTRPYWEFINSLSQDHFVYLTDIYKTFFYTDSSKKERSYVYYKQHPSKLSSIKNILEQEIELLKPDLIITLGKESIVQLTEQKCNKLSRNISLNKTHLKSFPNIPIIPLVHLSGATRKANIINFMIANNLNTSNFEKRWQYGLGYSTIIKNYINK